MFYMNILFKTQYLLSVQITSAALNTKTDFQVGVSPVEAQTLSNEVDRTSKIPKQPS